MHFGAQQGIRRQRGGGRGLGLSTLPVLIAIFLTASPGPTSATPQDPSGASSPPASALDLERENLRAAVARVQDNDNRNAETLLRAVVASPSFTDLTSDERHSALYFYGILLIASGDYAQAHAMLEKSTSMDETNGLDWHERLDAAARLGDDADSLYALATIADRWPTSLDQISARFIVSLDSRTRKSAGLTDARYKALSALANAGWRSTDPSSDADQLWLDLIEMLVAHGKTGVALAVAKNLDTPMAIVAMRADKAFDSVTSDDSALPAVTSVMASRLATLRSAAKAAPNDLLAAYVLADELISQNRPAEALSFVDETMARATATPTAASKMDNQDHLIWVMNSRSDALVMLGRDDEALATLAKAARRPEDGGPNVSQVLNLGQMYEELGRPKDALDQIKDVENMSGYGRMTQEGIRACSYAQLGDTAAVAASLNYMEAHQADAPVLFFETLLCTGDEDHAARYLTSQLADPKVRRTFLVRLQTYAPVREQPFAAEITRRRLRVRARPDVQAAILAVGHINEYALTLQTL
jgi:tetratricopeptide (TPR) repeat protein